MARYVDGSRSEWRFVVFGLIVAVVSVTPPVVGPAHAAGITPFDDVEATSPFIDAIVWLDQEGITKGCNPPANDLFCPDRGVTRGQMAAFLVRAFDLTDTDGTAFDDIGESEFEVDIERLATEGITKGCNPPANTLFCPDAPVTRGQMAAFLVRAFDLEPSDTQPFGDAQGHVFDADIAALAAAEITFGCNPPANDLFCVGDIVSREQMAAFLYRAAGSPPVATSFGDAGTREISRTPESSSDIIVEPGDDIAGVVAGASNGATIRFRAGTYRLASVVPQTGQKMIADPGVVLKGSKVLSDWSRDGDDWVIGGQTQGSSAPTEGEEWGKCISGWPSCVYPEGLYIDGVPIRQETSRSDVEPGKWYFDYSADRIYLGDDPSGHLVETSVSQWAFHGRNDDIRIEGFVIEQYANPARQGVINPREGQAGSAGRDWVVVGNTVRGGHGWGIKIEHGLVITDNFLEGNGQGGIGGVGDGVTIEHNEITGSCHLGIQCVGWEGGGMKLNTVNGVTVVANLVYRNAGHGIHTDIGSTNVLVAGNVVLSNDGYGIGHEIGGSAVIQNNEVVDNGWETSEPGINILDSHDVVVSANQVTDNYRGIMLRQDDRSSISRLGNVVVSANTVTLADETRTGVGNLQASIGSVTFAANRYIVPSSLSRPFTYDSTTYDWDGWRGLGFDQNSTFESR